MTCYGMARAFQHADVAIGWYPFRATGEVTVTTKPGGGRELGIIERHEGIARQSVRNPSHRPDPPMRAAVLGADGRHYFWGYRRAGAITGWIPCDGAELDPNAITKPAIRGPAKQDFEVGRTLPRDKHGPGCGKLSIKRPVLDVVAREAHFRYSARGTSFHYAHKGDRLKVLLVKCPHGFVFAEVVSAASDGSLRPEMRGYVLASAVGL